MCSRLQSLMLVFGATRTQAAAQECLTQVLANNSCNSTEVYFLWGTGTEEDVTARVQTPSMIPVASLLRTFAASYRPPEDFQDYWYLMSYENLSAAKEQDFLFVTFAAVVSNVAISFNEFKLVGLLPRSG
jgi:hypothetical protein